MLKERCTEEEYEQLPDEVREHYTEEKEGVYLLQSDGSGKLKRALQAERRGHERAVKLLSSVVPAVEEESDRSKWPDLVSEKVEVLSELGDEFDVDEYRRMVESSQDRDDSQLESDLKEARGQVRELQRSVAKFERDSRELQERGTALEKQNSDLIMHRDISRTMEDIRVAPGKGKYVGALWRQEYGLRVSDGETVVTQDDDEVPLAEFAVSWASTDEGKSFVSAPESSGAHRSESRVGKVDKSKATPFELAREAFGGG